ncbi:hypothetical protein ACNKXS_03660, partial [Christiangramia marina]|uniref:hypothetical protein n=1 Tax=Christiangramia marina TaxID=409436 RepID=UPI003AA83CCA
MKKKPLALILILVFIFFSLIPIFIWFDFISFQIYPENLDRRGEFLKLLINVYGFIFIVYGLYISQERTRAFQESVEKQDRQIANQTENIKLSRETLLHDQFKNAVQHLGSSKEPVILGGIAELNRLATDHPDKFSKLVCNIFSSFIRSEAGKDRSSSKINWILINTVIEILINNKEFSTLEKDLRGCNLSGIPLNNLELKNWNFSQCILFKYLDRITFKNCSFFSSEAYSVDYKW